MKTLVIIPAYNEAKNIERVVDHLSTNFPEYDYIVINDGSRDQTADLCRKRGYHLVDLPVNLGLSGAFQTGMRYAFLHNYEAAIQFDADGQHNAEYIVKMIDTMIKNNADIVIASRFVEKKKPLSFRMLGSRLIESVLRLTTGKTVKDPTSGMRLYNKKMIERYAHNMNYGPEPDTLAFLIRCGVLVKEVQAEMNERIAGESYLNALRSIQYMINMLLSITIFQYARKREV